MKQQYSMKDRFNQILLLCKMTVRDLSEHIGVHEKVFIRFISNEKISSDIGNKVEELGINSRWLLVGKGEIYNETEKGIKIKQMIETNKKMEVDFLYFKIITWIETHYSDIKNFEKEYKIDGFNYFDALKSKSHLCFELYKALKEDGLNMNWIYHNDTCPYNYSKNGREKKSWVINNLDHDNYIYNILKGTVE